MKKINFVLFSLVAVVLACGQYITITPIPAPSMTPIPSPTVTSSAISNAPNVAIVRQPAVNVRAEPNADSMVVGYLQSGDVVTILECIETWCMITRSVGNAIEHPFGWVWRGCLGGVNPDGLGCEAKP